MSRGVTWLYAQRQLPQYVSQGYRPWIGFVMERGWGGVVALKMAPSEREISPASIVAEAVGKPLAGPPRSPARLHVESKELAAALRADLGIDVFVEERIPEIDDFFLGFVQNLEDGDREKAGDLSYEEQGIPRDVLPELFSTAAILLAAQPWKLIGETETFRVDVPSLGISAACASVIGRADEARGVLLFRSRLDWEAFLGRSRRLSDPRNVSPPLLPNGPEVLSFDLEDASEASTGMREDAQSLGLGEPAAFPRLGAIDPSGVPRPLRLEEIHLLGAVTRAMSAFSVRHASALRRANASPVSETQTGAGPAVRLSFPFEAASSFAINQPVRRRLGRNDPCHCGGGRKYKVCHAEADEAAERELRVARERASIDRDMRGELLQIVGENDPAALKAVERREETAFEDTLTVAWTLFHRGLGGPARPTPAQRLLTDPRLDPAERLWLEAQARAWVSLWHVAQTVPGLPGTVRFSLKDLLTGEDRADVPVDAETGTRLMRGDVFLGRVVDFPWGPRIDGRGAGTASVDDARSLGARTLRGLAAPDALKGALATHRASKRLMTAWEKSVR